MLIFCRYFLVPILMVTVLILGTFYFADRQVPADQIQVIDGVRIGDNSRPDRWR